MKTYRIALIGCGPRGTAAARAYHAHPRTEVVAVCDRVQELRDKLGEELNVSARFADLEEMLSDVGADLAVIATGTEFHHELALRALECGVHIDIEKPLCTDLQQADEVMAKAQEKHVQVAVHHQGRVASFMQAVGRAVNEGRIGEVRYLQGSCKGYYGGLGLMNIGTHIINNFLKFAGECRSVTAMGLTDGHPVTPEDVVGSPLGMGTIAGEHIAATLHFGGSLTASLLHHRFAPMDSTGYMLEVYGTEGRLFWNHRGAWWLPQPHYVPDGEHDQWQPLEPVYPSGYDPGCGTSEDEYWFVEEYVRALEEDREHECSGVEGRHVLEIMMGIFESAAYGRRVDLPQEQRDHPLLRWRREHGLGGPAAVQRGYGEWLAAEDQRLGRCD
ncbi:MAG: Gfo/Idh/MocA family oxidoreductase [Armatimonadetes bacterium]|nr:Gfo/Idh/MocA family oxidoreductase [Armatimonadota bacterium]